MSQTKVTYNGIGFIGLLTIVLIALKLTGDITLSWFWIILIPLSPILIVIGVGLMLLFLVIVATMEAILRK